jgi:hypothetical protein
VHSWRRIAALLFLWAPARAEQPAYRQLLECYQGMIGVAGAASSEQAWVLAHACSSASPSVGAYAKADPGQGMRALLEGGDLFCSPASRQAFLAATDDDRWAALARTCGAARYDLPEGQEALLSEKWFVLDRIGRWVASLAHSVDPRVQAALTDLTVPSGRRGQLPLPLPSRLPGHYRLPSGAHLDHRETEVYFVVEDQSLAIGIVPAATFTRTGLELIPLPGAKLPGASLALGDSLARMTALEKQLENSFAHFGARLAGPTSRRAAARVATAPARPPSNEEIPAWLMKRGPPLSPVEEKAWTAYLAELERIRNALEQHGAPLLADSALPAGRNAAVVGALGPNGARLACGWQGQAVPHAVALVGRGAAIPAKPTLEVALTHAGIRLDGQPVPDEALRQALERTGHRFVAVTIQDGTVADLARLLDLVAAAGHDLVLLD